MNTVTISVASRDDVTKRALAAFGGQTQGNFISFETAELLWQTLSKKRMEIVAAMTGQTGMSIRELARRVGRDVKAVHKDVHVLLNAGIIERGDDGRIHFPYDQIHVDFTIGKAA